MDSDTHIPEVVNGRRIDWLKVVVWLGLLGYCWAFWYGVAKAL